MFPSLGAGYYVLIGKHGLHHLYTWQGYFRQSWHKNFMHYVSCVVKFTGSGHPLNWFTRASKNDVLNFAVLPYKFNLQWKHPKLQYRPYYYINSISSTQVMHLTTAVCTPGDYKCIWYPSVWKSVLQTSASLGFHPKQWPAAQHPLDAHLYPQEDLFIYSNHFMITACFTKEGKDIELIPCSVGKPRSAGERSSDGVACIHKITAIGAISKLGS